MLIEHVVEQTTSLLLVVMDGRRSRPRDCSVVSRGHRRPSAFLEAAASTFILPSCRVLIIVDASHRDPGEEALLDNGVDAPVAVDHLGDAEVDSDRDKRNRLVLGQSLGIHQECAHLAESVLER